MAVYAVTYDLRAPGREYNDLYKAIKRYTCCHALDSTWFIDTNSTAAEVRDALCETVDKGDQIYVLRLRKAWAACRTEDCTKWIKSDSRTW